jgi:hypothetical protein
VRFGHLNGGKSSPKTRIFAVLTRIVLLVSISLSVLRCSLSTLQIAPMN